MNFQAKILGPLLFIPLLVGVQGSSTCRRAAPTNSSSVNVNVNLNNNQNVNADALAQIPSGNWGGNHIRLVVGSEGADVEYDCAHGSIAPPLTIGAEGRFDLKGTHTIERPGPVRMGDESPERPVRYQGRIDGKEMTLKVTFTDTSELVGEFALNHGINGRLVKCL